MSREAGFGGVLRWYPAAWRRRYGQELVALMEDTYGDHPVPVRGRLALARSGLVERLRGGGLTGPSRSPLAGSLLVLWAWGAFTVAGAGLAKLAEHWAAAVPRGGTLLPAAGFDLVYGAGLAGGLIVAAAAALCARPVLAFARSGGWRQVGHLLVPAAALTLATATGIVVMALWARHLTPYQRNGGWWPYGLLADAVAALITGTVAAWAAVVTGTARRMELPARVLRWCGRLAVSLAVVMAVLVGGTVTWWAAVASRAPWFLAGTAPGTTGTPAPALLVIIGVVMTLALITAALGARRILASFRRPAGSSG